MVIKIIFRWVFFKIKNKYYVNLLIFNIATYLNEKIKMYI